MPTLADRPPWCAPSDVPALRREIAGWLAECGAIYYTRMILVGRQPIRPTGPAGIVGPSLAAEERRRVADADLWYFDADLCELLASAHTSMPRFAPQPHDLPSQSGLVVFAQPIIDRDPQDEVDLSALMDDMGIAGAARELISTAPIEIGAAAWGPCPYPDPDKTPAGALWVTFYSRARLAASADEAINRAARMLPQAMPDNEAVVPWLPDAADPEQWLLPAPAARADSTWSWAALLFAAFRIAGQVNLATQTAERPARPERRRTQRAGLPERDVRVVRLRHTEHAQPGGQDGTGREYRHRWVVRGHWRNQSWGPERRYRRPVWVLPHVKGPDGAPLLGGDRVTVATAPQQRQGEVADVDDNC